MLTTHKDWRTAWYSYISEDGDYNEDFVADTEFVPNDTQAGFMAAKFGAQPVVLWYGTGDDTPHLGAELASVVTGDQRLNIHECGVALLYGSELGAVFLPAEV
jgi:hypothetical protein